MMIGGRRSRVRAVVLAVAVAVVVAVGCGSSDEDAPGATAAERGGGGAKAEVGAAYEAFIDALYAGRAREACGMLTSPAKYQLTGGDPCIDVVRRQLEPTSLSKPRPRILSIRIDGDEAVVKAASGRSEPRSIPLLEERGEWRIDSGF